MNQKNNLPFFLHDFSESRAGRKFCRKSSKKSGRLLLKIYYSQNILTLLTQVFLLQRKKHYNDISHQVVILCTLEILHEFFSSLQKQAFIESQPDAFFFFFVFVFCSFTIIQVDYFLLLFCCFLCFFMGFM